MYWFLGVLLLSSLAASAPTKNGTRIVGGRQIDITEAPYQVSLRYRDRHSCGGSIIAEDLIVTAAHCVIGSRPEYLKIRAGSTSMREGGTIIQVEDLMYHEWYSSSSMDYDVAMLMLKEPLTFSDRIQPIELDDQDYEIEDGNIVFVSGWGNMREGGGGLPTKLQGVEVPIVNSDDCNDAYSPIYDITPRMLCAGSKAGGKDACQGDSGGPLTHEGRLSGIVSWGIGCARPDFPGVYSKVAALREWLDDKKIVLRARKVLRY